MLFSIEMLVALKKEGGVLGKQVEDGVQWRFQEKG